MAEFRYLAQRIGGEAHGEVFETELPLDNARRGRALSAPPTASGTISTRVARLVAPDGQPLIKPWHTAIYAVVDDIIRGGYLVLDSRWNGQSWDLPMAGFTGYAAKQPFNGVKEYVDTDPADIWRDIWLDLQSQPGGYMALNISSVQTPVRVGTAARQVEFTTGEGEDVAFEANDGARKLNWWSTFDCGREIDNLASETPFDWREWHVWDDTVIGGIAHYVDLGYPSLGGRKIGPRLVYTENVITEPQAAANPDYATDILVLGAGEGKDRVRGYAGRPLEGLRRVKVVEDRDVDSKGQADVRARRELGTTRDEVHADTLVVERHSNADIDALEPGDELPLFAELTHVTIDQWVKVVDIQATDADPDRIEITVVNPS